MLCSVGLRLVTFLWLKIVHMFVNSGSVLFLEILIVWFVRNLIRVLVIVM